MKSMLIKSIIPILISILLMLSNTYCSQKNTIKAALQNIPEKNKISDTTIIIIQEFSEHAYDDSILLSNLNDLIYAMKDENKTPINIRDIFSALISIICIGFGSLLGYYFSNQNNKIIYKKCYNENLLEIITFIENQYFVIERLINRYNEILNIANIELFIIKHDIEFKELKKLIGKMIEKYNTSKISNNEIIDNQELSEIISNLNEMLKNLNNKIKEKINSLFIINTFNYNYLPNKYRENYKLFKESFTMGHVNFDLLSFETITNSLNSLLLPKRFFI